MSLYYAPTVNGLQKTLDAQLSSGVTASMTLDSVTGIQNEPGVVVINRIDGDGNEKSASVREYVAYTAVSGSTLTGLTRNVDGGTSDQDHAVGSVVEFVADVTAWQGLIDTFTTEHGTDGTHDKSGADTTLITGTAGTDGYLSKWNADGDLVDGFEPLGNIEFLIDGGGAVIGTGVAGWLQIDTACTINSVTLLADQSGSIVIDIWKDTYANYPPTDADSITASAVPTISTATKSTDATLTGWTTSISAGDILYFNVDSCSTITQCLLSLKVTRS